MADTPGTIIITDGDVITKEQYEETKRAEAKARSTRIDLLSIDKSPVMAISLPRWSPEAECYEPQFEKIREDVTLQEKMDAWRVLFSHSRRAWWRILGW